MGSSASASTMMMRDSAMMTTCPRWKKSRVLQTRHPRWRRSIEQHRKANSLTSQAGLLKAPAQGSHVVQFDEDRESSPSTVPCVAPQFCLWLGSLTVKAADGAGVRHARALGIHSQE